MNCNETIRIDIDDYDDDEIPTELSLYMRDGAGCYIVDLCKDCHEAYQIAKQKEGG
jgi:hypothetical protein